jgi:CarD family transcriptional regulator
MFERDEYVFHESGGVCRIADICYAPLEGMPADRQYYVIKPIHDPNSVIYMPVDSTGVFLRPLMDRAEACALLDRISTVEWIDEPNAKLLRAKYIEAMHRHEPEEWVRVIKTVTRRIRMQTSPSRRISDTERSFAEAAKRHLYTELALVLGHTEQEMAASLAEDLQKMA